jgi:hypothetical protein
VVRRRRKRRATPQAVGLKPTPAYSLDAYADIYTAADRALIEFPKRLARLLPLVPHKSRY